MTLIDQFNSVEPRERAGSQSSDRSHYQKDWALCKLLKLHSSESEYLVAFDIHDDVVVFEDETQPETMFFYQIKTKDAEWWTLKALLNRNKSKKETGKLLPSILGNLYHNAVVFPLHAKRLTLVSNAPFKIALSADEKNAAVLTQPETPFENLPQKNQQEIVTALKKEHSLVAEPVLDKLLWFEKAELPLEGHDVFTRGKLGDFLSEMNPTGKHNISVIYRVLIDEVRRKNDYTRKELTFQEVRDNKSIGRSDFAKILKAVASDDKFEKALIDATNQLQSENADFQELQAFRRNWAKAIARRAELDDAAFRKVSSSLEELAITEQSTLKQTIEFHLTEAKSKLAGIFGIDDDLLRALLVMKIFDLL